MGIDTPDQKTAVNAMLAIEVANSRGFEGWKYSSTTKSFHRFDDKNKVPVAAELERLWVSWGSALSRDYMSSREIQDELSDSHGIRKDFGDVVETLKKYRHRP
jgi:hypothetical protein